MGADQEAWGRVLLASTLYLPNIGGVENSLRHLSSAYRTLGIRPWILTSTGGDPDAPNQWLELKRIHGVPVLRYRFSNLAIVRALRSFLALRALLRKRKFRAFVSRDQHSAVAAVLLGCNGVYVVPGIASIQHKPSGLNPLRWLNHFTSVALQRFALRYIRAVAVFSEQMAEAVVAEVGRAEVHKVRPGVDASRFTFIGRDLGDERRASLGIGQGKKVAVGVGRFSRQKRFDLAIDAIASSPEEWHLVLVGDGPLRREFEQRVKDLDLCNRVTFTGHVTNPEWYLQLADVFVLPSDYEPFGQVVIEAMACGLAVVALNPMLPGVDTATNEIVPEQWLARADAVSGVALASALLSVGSAGSDRVAISDWTLSAYSWEVLADDLLRLGRSSGVSPLNAKTLAIKVNS